MDKVPLKELEKYVNHKAFGIFKNAFKNCHDLRERATTIVNTCLRDCNVPLKNVCVVAVGSLGRSEALGASDIDLIPILKSKKLVDEFKKCDQIIRETLEKQLGVHVSKGESLTRAASVTEFADAHLIGTEADNVMALTKRILILTEGICIGGKWDINQVREQILEGYSGMDRTRGRHVLSLVNDLARYFRTLCIEYKGKVDGEEKDWSTRNMKLRYSRKFWYFSNVIALSSIAERHPRGERAYEKELLRIFSISPYMRLLEEIGRAHRVEVGRILECFSVFLEFMSCPKRRLALAKVQHDERYAVNLDNPFPGLKYNSDLMHSYMVDILNGMNLSARRRVLDWFLL